MRIGINVPNELLQRLEPLKPELNISQVCREALEAKASSYERMRERLGDPAVQQAMRRVWEREQEFRAIITVDWEQLGYEDAVAWVQAATLQDWQDLHKRQEFLRRQGRPESAPIPPRLPDVKNFDDRLGEYPGWDTNQSEEFIDWLHYENISLDVAAADREYRAAWMAYANAAWERFRQMEKEYAAERSRQRQESIRNRPPPDAPAHLLPELEPTPEPQPEKPPFRVVPHHGKLAPGLESVNLNHLNAQLEEEELLAKLARSGPMKPEPAPDPQPEKPPFRVTPHNGKFAPGVAEMNLNHLAAELDTELFLEKRERDRAREQQEEQEKSQ